jgi:predicted patatin/cPLA2 family phospholipase
MKTEDQYEEVYKKITNRLKKRRCKYCSSKTRIKNENEHRLIYTWKPSKKHLVGLKVLFFIICSLIIFLS